MNKVFYDGNPVGFDKDCALEPPEFITGEETQRDYYKRQKRVWQSAPCVVKTPGGRLFVTFSGDNSEMKDECPNNYNVLMYSDDGGFTWAENALILDHPAPVRMHGPLMFMAPDGVLWLFWAQSYIWWDSRGGVWCARCKKPDAAELVFDAPRRLCDGVMATQPIITSKGEMLLPVSIWKRFPKHEYNYLPELEYSCVYASTDGGETFALRGKADDPDTTFDENALVELSDGRLMMITRDTAAISVCHSSDDGATWTTPHRLMKHVSSRSLLTKFPSGRILLITNDPEGLENGRCMMTAFLSDDDGETFPHKLLLYKNPNVSYPAGMMQPDGRMLVTFDRNRYNEREFYMSSFTEGDILAGKCVAEGSFAARLILRADDMEGRADKAFDNGLNI